MENSIVLQLNLNMSNLIKTINLLNNEQIKFKILDTSNPSFQIPALPSNTKPNVYYKKNLGRFGLQILELLSEGYNYAGVAEQLDISINGVRYYVKKIFHALNVTNGREAVKIYLTEIKGNN